MAAEMPDATQPLEIAREALRRPAMRQLQPTPENYRSLHHEIAGTRTDDLFPERALKLVSSSLPRLNRSRIEFVERLESASSAEADRRSAVPWLACCAPRRRLSANIRLCSRTCSSSSNAITTR
jgi:hypothetical protein